MFASRLSGWHFFYPSNWSWVNSREIWAESLSFTCIHHKNTVNTERKNYLKTFDMKIAIACTMLMNVFLHNSGQDLFELNVTQSLQMRITVEQLKLDYPYHSFKLIYPFIDSMSEKVSIYTHYANSSQMDYWVLHNQLCDAGEHSNSYLYWKSVWQFGQMNYSRNVLLEQAYEGKRIVHNAIYVLYQHKDMFKK